MGIQEIKGNLFTARRAWEAEQDKLAAAREQVMQALVGIMTLGAANTSSTAATRVAYSHKGSMEQGGEFAMRLADQTRAIISNQATALRVVVADLDKVAPSIEAQIQTINQMLQVLES